MNVNKLIRKMHETEKKISERANSYVNIMPWIPEDENREEMLIAVYTDHVFINGEDYNVGLVVKAPAIIGNLIRRSSEFAKHIMYYENWEDAFTDWVYQKTDGSMILCTVMTNSDGHRTVMIFKPKGDVSAEKISNMLLSVFVVE